MRTFNPSGDKQLWRLVDSVDGKECAWPLLITPGTDFGGESYLIEPAIPFQLPEQHAFVNQRLSAISFDTSGSVWLIRHSLLHKISVAKCNGITPEYYLKWNADTVPVETPVPEPETVRKAIDEDFVRYVCAEAGLSDIGQARTYFNVFCWMSMRWLLEDHKPLDLGYAQIHAVPYRANWKGILHAKFPNILGTFHKQHEVCQAVLEDNGFNNTLYADDLIACNNNGTFQWTLEIEPDSVFSEEAYRVEKEALESAGDKPGRYVTRWSGLVKKLNENILNIFESFLEKASVPLASVDTSLPINSLRMVPRRCRSRVRPVAPPVPVTYHTTDTRSPDNEPVTKADIDDEKDAKV